MEKRKKGGEDGFDAGEKRNKNENKMLLMDCVTPKKDIFGLVTHWVGRHFLKKWGLFSAISLIPKELADNGVE